MASKFAIDPEILTTVLTSCGRFDLLKDTVASFLEHFDAEKIIIAEDSEKTEEAAAFAQAFPCVEMRVNVPKLGQMRSIDALYATITTPYVVHLEDDWGFTRSLDLASVIAFLEMRPDISVVCIARRVYDPRFAKSARKTRAGGIDYLVWDLDAHPKWFSYSFNPSVARMALWREIGPFAPFVTEEDLSLYCKSKGMRIALVDPGIADHIGDDRHAHDPFQPPRAKTLVARLKRSFAKRLARLRPGDAS
jgi:Glycosyl transferase family 2